MYVCQIYQVFFVKRISKNIIRVRTRLVQNNLIATNQNNFLLHSIKMGWIFIERQTVTTDLSDLSRLTSLWRVPIKLRPLSDSTNRVAWPFKKQDDHSLLWWLFFTVNLEFKIQIRESWLLYKNTLASTLIYCITWFNSHTPNLEMIASNRLLVLFK